MKKAELERYRRQLEKLKSRMRSDAIAVAEQARTVAGGQAAGELSNVPMHLGDSGTDAFLHDLNATLVENEEYLANEVRAALQRIDQGTYGRCEQCGRPIAKERLDAMPFARRCVSCADTDDRAPDVNLDVGRPRKPADTLSPEGEMQEDELSEQTSPAEIVPGSTDEDSHAAGTPGGGTALGGLAGSNVDSGEPEVLPLQDFAGSGDLDAAEERVDRAAAARPVVPIKNEEVQPAERGKEKRSRSSRGRAKSHSPKKLSD